MGRAPQAPILWHDFFNEIPDRQPYYDELARASGELAEERSPELRNAHAERLP